MTGVMPVAGRLAKSWAITSAAPRRNPYGEATIRAIADRNERGVPSDVEPLDQGDRIGPVVSEPPRTERAA